MKVSELTGDTLDYWVARAEQKSGFVSVVLFNCTFDGVASKGIADYSTDWAGAGPIIERERIAIFSAGEYGWAAFIQENPDCPHVDTHAADEMCGPTPLIAAMRAYVASKFGAEVPSGAGEQP